MKKKEKHHTGKVRKSKHQDYILNLVEWPEGVPPSKNKHAYNHQRRKLKH